MSDSDEHYSYTEQVRLDHYKGLAECCSKLEGLLATHPQNTAFASALERLSQEYHNITGVPYKTGASQTRPDNSTQTIR